jgi:predicted TPR repeat methyltransferase
VSLPASYFDALYAASDDPWEFATRWYEKRKYAVTLAALPRERYRRGFEPGCSNGVFTVQLAKRCDRLLAADTAAAAVAIAKTRLTDQPHVEIRQLAVPSEWPGEEFDLIVLSELGYYLSVEDLEALATAATASLAADGTLAVVHWRHPVEDYPLAGDEVHAVISRATPLRRVVHHDEPDFLLDVYGSPASPTVAEAEGLVVHRGEQ